MSAASWGQVTVAMIVGAFLLWGYLKVVVWIGRRLHAADLRAQERRRVRLRALVDLADAYDAAESDKERAKLYRRAEALGFTEGPFALDDSDHPHPRNAA